MNGIDVLYTFSILVVVFVSGFFIDSSRRRRDIPGIRAFMWLSVVVGLTAALEGFSILAPSAGWARFWFELRFAGLASIPVIWFIFVMQYAGYGRWLDLSWKALLWIVPAATQAVIWTNSAHGLWEKKPPGFFTRGPFFIAQTAERIPGIWMWVHLAYSYVLVAIGLLILVSVWLRFDHFKTRQIVLIGAGALVMAVAAPLPGLGLIPESWFNPLIPGLAIGMSLALLGIYLGRFPQTRLPLLDAGRMPSALIALFALLTTCIILAGYFYHWHYERAYRTEVEQILTSIGDLKMRELVQWRKERLADAAVLHDNPVFVRLVRRSLQSPDDLESRKELRAWLEGTHRSYEYKNVFLLDHLGRPIVVVNGSRPAVCDEIRKHLTAIAKINRPVFLDFHREVSDGSITLSVLAPIFIDRRFAGVVALVIDPGTYLYPMIQRWPTPSQTAETLLVRREGDEVLFLNELKYRKNSALTLRLPLSQKNLPAARAAKGEEGVIEGVDYRGRDVIAALRMIPDSPWAMVVRIDQEEIYAPLRERLRIMVVVVFLLIGGVGFAVLMLWQIQKTSFQMEKVDAAEALLASEERFRQIFEAANVGKSITKPTGEVNVNESFCQMLGYTREEMKGKRWQDVTPESEVEVVEKAIAPLKTGEKKSTRFTKRYIRKDGSCFWADVSVAGFYGADGVLKYFITTVIDITDRVKAEKALAKLNADLDRRVDERTRELQAKTEDLERINKLFVDRELRMRELKARIAVLEGKTADVENPWVEKDG